MHPKICQLGSRLAVCAGKAVIMDANHLYRAPGTASKTDNVHL